MHSTISLSLLSTFGCLVAANKSFYVDTYRATLDHGTNAQNGTGAIQGMEKALYWYGTLTVGGQKDVVCLIDTGSTDLIVPKGRYVPYHEKPYPGNPNFTTEYEGVNRAGFGFEQINGTVRLDRVQLGDLTVPYQAIGEVESTKVVDAKKPKHFNLAEQSILGFAGKGASAFTPQAPSWFDNLCINKAIDECRFGLAFGYNGTGQVIVGKLDSSLVDGSLTTVPMVHFHGLYVVNGDVFVNGKSVYKNQTFILDVGTDNLQSPVGPAKKISDMLGFETVLKSGPDVYEPNVPIKNLLAYYNCKNPPTLGFGFPPANDLKSGQKQGVYTIPNSSSIWDVYKNKNGNCTSILGGTNLLSASLEGGTSLWFIGQPFFQGHYMDFNVGEKMMGIGNLKNPDTGK